MILFRNENHVVAGMFQFTCHPTVLGIHNMKISSDLLGNVGKALDEKYNTIFITMQGACGDMGNRQYRQGNDENELWRVRDEVMKQVNVFRRSRNSYGVKSWLCKNCRIHHPPDL